MLQLQPYVDARRTAIAIIDVQNDFFHEQGALAQRDSSGSNRQKIIEPLKAFLQECRRHGVPVIFIQTIHSARTDSIPWKARIKRHGRIVESTLCREGTWGAEFYQITPKDQDHVVVKHRYSAFFGTRLDSLLRSLGVETLLLAGTATNVCVESAARDGISHDYTPVVLSDCSVAATEADHEGALERIRNYFGFVAKSTDVVDMWRSRKQGDN